MNRLHVGALWNCCSKELTDLQRSAELDGHSPMTVVHMELLQWSSGDALLDRRAGKAKISCLHGV